MPAETPGDAGEITFVEQPDGFTRVELALDGHPVSWLFIAHFILMIGEARVRMDGIAGVGTEEAHRKRGFSRRVLEATLDRMRRGDAALSMLYGIPNFYPKFGYATAGPDHFISLTVAGQPVALPEGWRARAFERGDLPAVMELYDRGTAGAVGAAVRPETAWGRLLDLPGTSQDACRVLEGPDGRLRAYLWRARGCWYVGNCERAQPSALVLGEVMADGPAAAEAALDACQAWAAEPPAEGAVAPEQVLLAWPPEGSIADAARRRAAQFQARYSACGGSMARVMDVDRLLVALAPELTHRLRASRDGFRGRLRIDTDLGAGDLVITGEEVRFAPAGEGAAPDRVASLPQHTLAQLALGAFPPVDVLGRLDGPLSAPARELLVALFPMRHPHMHLPDRF